MTRKLTIAKSYTFEAAHQLGLNENTPEENFKLFGKCARLHGHSYTLTVEVTREVDAVTGMVINYSELDNIVRPLLEERLDHHFLNTSLSDVEFYRDGWIHTNFQMTAENIAEAIAWLLTTPRYDSPMFNNRLTLVSITIQETAKTKAVFRP
jgi:6-pyruvoyltetrahydropterin/6-carboxytetrahydropterin synthase